MSHGKVLFKYGTMSSGKSLLLLAKAHNFQDNKIPFVILKSTIDTRDGDGVIHSRALGDRQCVSISPESSIYDIIVEYLDYEINFLGEALKWILVDEAQFLTPTQVDQLAAIADNYNINVICYGLRTDFKTHLFPGSQRLFEIADTIEEIKASCKCNCKTIFNARVNDKREVVVDGEQVEVGGDERYISLCRKCYLEQTNHPLYKKKNIDVLPRISSWDS